MSVNINKKREKNVTIYDLAVAIEDLVKIFKEGFAKTNTLTELKLTLIELNATMKLLNRN